MPFQSITSADELLGLESVAFVNACYRGLLDREADESGFAYYLERLQSGDSRLSIAASIASSPEAMALPVGRKLLHAQVLARRMDELLSRRMSPRARQTALHTLSQYFAVLIGRAALEDAGTDNADPFESYFASVIEGERLKG